MRSSSATRPAKCCGGCCPFSWPCAGVSMSSFRWTRSPRRSGTTKSSTARACPMTTYREFHRRSIEDKEGFWAEQAKLVHWEKPPEKVLDYGRPPFARWFVGGETNLCYNAVDRHLAEVGFSSDEPDRKSTRLNSSHGSISYAVVCLKKKRMSRGLGEAMR